MTLIQEQVPILQSVEDNISETDVDDWAEKIEFTHLNEHTIQEKMRSLLDQK